LDQFVTFRSMGRLFETTEIESETAVFLPQNLLKPTVNEISEP